MLRGAGCREPNPRLRRREKNVLDIPLYRTGHSVNNPRMAHLTRSLVLWPGYPAHSRVSNVWDGRRRSHQFRVSNVEFPLIPQSAMNGAPDSRGRWASGSNVWDKNVCERKLDSIEGCLRDHHPPTEFIQFRKTLSFAQPADVRLILPSLPTSTSLGTPLT
jgi:hypothetical protein